MDGCEPTYSHVRAKGVYDLRYSKPRNPQQIQMNEPDPARKLHGRN